jgi:hypothetical protein
LILFAAGNSRATSSSPSSKPNSSRHHKVSRKLQQLRSRASGHPTGTQRRFAVGPCALQQCCPCAELALQQQYSSGLDSEYIVLVASRAFACRIQQQGS